MLNRHSPPRCHWHASRRGLLAGLGILVLLTTPGCNDSVDAASAPEWENLAPVPNPQAADEPAPVPQPLRANPYAVAMSADGNRAVVTLRGNELRPQAEVVVIDVPARRVVGRAAVGARPTAARIRPGGDVAIVLSQFSPFAAIVDLQDGATRGKIRVGYYAEELTFSADGNTMYVTNRAEDTVQQWRLAGLGGGINATLVRASPAGINPSAIALSAEEDKLYVADRGGLSVRVFSTVNLEQLAVIQFDAQVFGLAPMGQWIAATTLNDTSGLPCESDGDFIGTQGDGVFPMVTDRTCGRGFADIQNEIAFIDPRTDTIAIRYTSDTAEISEADREGDHDPALMQVVGALPFAVAVVRPTRAYVTMSASDQLVELSIDGNDPPAMTMPRSWPTGFTPKGLAVNAEGTLAVVANTLGDSVSIIDLTQETASAVDTIDIGSSGRPFPATDAEVGELFFNSAKFSTDGDISCTHCHPNMENDGKAWGVDIVRAFGRRSTLPLRNLKQTKPLLVEGVFDENDFTLEMEAISLRLDFHDTSYTLQVQRRDDFYRKTSGELFGREVGYEEMARDVAALLMVESRLLPSPFDKSTPQVERGKAIFERPDVGCSACHPAPTFASPELFAGVTTVARYDLPKRDLDPNVSVKYIENARDGFFNANSLRGLWDRRGSLFHDGRARTVRETILTPNHKCLQLGERAFNEFNGQVDTNGGVSHLTCDQINDLVAFLMTID